LIVVLGSSVAGCSGSSPQAPPPESATPSNEAQPSKSAYLIGSLRKDEPQPIYAADRDDPWNRIFYCLFTRTVRLRLSDDFPEGAPFRQPPTPLMPQRSISDSTFERIESGDRAIEPLYPSFLTASGPFQVLDEPRYSQLTKALTDALQERADRTPLARASMQSDAWAAYDILFRKYGSGYENKEGEGRRARRDKLLGLLAKLIRRLALSSKEIEALPDNYAAAASAHHLPDLFAPDSAWMEVRRGTGREHDYVADSRRAARVFIKPAKPPRDVDEFLSGLRDARGFTPQLSAVALVTQNLLIDDTGKVVPSPLTYEVQLRTFVKDEKAQSVHTDLQQYEVSRRLLLSEPKTGGFVASDDKAPAYLPMACNDYGFAGNSQAGQPVLVSLRTRCMHCHGEQVATVITFGTVQKPPPPPVVRLRPTDNDCARDVARLKLESSDFKALQQQCAGE
jgi:hypothetical protein